MHDEVMYAERALKAGARGSVMKQEAASVMLDSIATVLSGKIYVSAAMRDRLLVGAEPGPVGDGAPRKYIIPEMYQANPDSAWPSRPALDRLKAYTELTKPRITLLVLAVSIASFYLASPGSVAWPRLFLTTLGTTLLAFGVFALNHYGERDTDGMMRRTDRRPLPGKRLTPREVLSFGSSLTTVAVVLICATLGWVAGAVALFTFISYVLVYTPLKRRSAFHTALGALSGATPPLLGWAGATGTVDLNAWILFGILFFWQFPHFLAIEMMYRDDYARGGIRVLPVVEPSGRAAAAEMMAALVLLAGVSLAPFFTRLAGAVYLAGSAALGCAFIAAGAVVLRRADRRAARLVLRVSVVYLPVLFGLMVANAVR